MARKAWLLSLITLIAVSLGVATIKGFCKEKKSSKTSDTEAISEKIDEVLKNQQDIIRVRASR